jgi:hypothetical protein
MQLFLLSESVDPNGDWAKIARYQHLELGIPLQYRVYWIEPEILKLTGIDVPKELSDKFPNPNYIIPGRHPFVPAEEMRDWPNLNQGKVEAGYTNIVTNGKWLAITGRDSGNRLCWAICLPPQAAKSIKPKLDSQLTNDQLQYQKEVQQIVDKQVQQRILNPQRSRQIKKPVKKGFLKRWFG